MRAKCIALIIVGFVLYAVSSAQEYSIRANRGLNLRAAPSLDSAIADTVPAGAILQVVGKFSRWLKINRGEYEAWLADWVNFSRVDSIVPTGSQQPTAEIDNCCYFDRECQNDHEWIAGYWAYRNGQCAAPAQPQPATPAQYVASAPATVDNCCYVDRQCQTDDDWLTGYWAFQNNQCPAAPAQQTASSAPTRPVIRGSDRFVRHVGLVLDWLASQAPEWYHYVISGLSIIVEVPVPDQGTEQVCTALAYTRERKASLETCWTNSYQLDGLGARMDKYSTAVALGHEACHVHRYEAGFVYDSTTSEQEEFECRKIGMGVGVALIPYPKYMTRTFEGERSLNVVRRYCREGFNPELYCPTIQRLYGG